METVQLDLTEKGKGKFFIAENGEQVGEMEVGVSDGVLTVYHTEVVPQAEGRGLAKELFLAMTGYAREQHLQVKAYCPYALAQFKRHPQDYADIWKQS